MLPAQNLTHTFLSPQQVWEDRSVPLAPCFVDKCQPDPAIKTSDIPVSACGHETANNCMVINPNFILHLSPLVAALALALL